MSGDPPSSPRAPARPWAGALGAVVAALLLSACGSSAGAGTAQSGTAASSSTNGSGATGTAKQTSGVCEPVSAPGPKGPQHVPKPHARLDPTKRYVVTLATNCGAITIQLDVKRAPRTSASFAYLVRRGFYDDLTFHRVAANFVIQGGDPEGDGSGGPGYTIVERPPADVRYTLGTVAMAKTGADPAGASGSQFFIVTAPEAPLPAQYALLGKVVGSFAAIQAIAKQPTVPPQDGAPEKPVVISHATLSES
ncbi:MAG TPA: peptidylprolyl isomerase [Solirubrobacteraceae bacterium]